MRFVRFGTEADKQQQAIANSDKQQAATGQMFFDKRQASIFDKRQASILTSDKQAFGKHFDKRQASI